MKILVVGASGVLGGAVVRGLLERGVAVRAMTRLPERAGDLAALGAEVVQGDLIDAASLQRACTGVDRVLAAAHGLLGRGRYRSEEVDGRGHRALIDAARGAGVDRFVYASASGAAADHPVDFFRTKHAIERYLQASGLAHAVLRPTAFMEQHVHDFNGKAVLERGKAQLIGAGTKKRNFVAAGNVASFAIEALLAEPLPASPLGIGGPGNFSNAEVAALYARLAGIAPRVSHLPAAVARGMSVLARPFHPGMARVLQMFSLPDDAYAETFDSADLQRTHPQIRLTTLELFVRARVAEHRVTTPR